MIRPSDTASTEESAAPATRRPVGARERVLYAAVAAVLGLFALSLAADSVVAGLAAGAAAAFVAGLAVTGRCLGGSCRR